MAGNAQARLRRQLVAALEAHLAQGGPPRPPVAGQPIWQAFAALSDLRQWGEATPQPIQPSEVEAWAKLARCYLPPHHAAMIFAMDAAWLRWQRTPEADRVAGPLTGAVFDAMLG